MSADSTRGWRNREVPVDGPVKYSCPTCGVTLQPVEVWDEVRQRKAISFPGDHPCDNADE